MAKYYKIPLIKPYFPRSALSGENLEFWVGREEQIDHVVRGLLASTDAHYLITGYSGIGKTSFVSRVIAEWRKLSAVQGISRVLIFNLHFAQPQLPEDVVKRLIGKVYFGSLDGQFLPTKKLAERLQLNYIQAHSKSLKETQAETTTHESGREATVDLTKVVTMLGGKLGASSKRSKGISRSLEIQKEYNLSMATSDFEAALHLLTQSKSFQSRFFERLRRWIFRVGSDVYRSRILFVFDQIDDLKFVQELSGFFNIPSASFIVLGGMKLQEQISSAREQGIQALDNFDEVYLPCQWDKAQEVLSQLIDPKSITPRKFADYIDHLNFCSQGLPRRLFAAIDQHTKRSNNEFYLGISLSEQKRIKLCAQLHRILWKHRKDILGSHIDSVQHHFRDKSLRGAYHLTDRIFRIVKFSFEDANTVATQISEAIIHPKRELMLRKLLKIFVNYGLLIKDGSTYRLSETILNLVKQIPDWLKDGYVDAQELINEAQRFEERDMPSMLDIRSARKKRQQAPKYDDSEFDPKRDVVDEEQQAEVTLDRHHPEEIITSPNLKLAPSGREPEGQILDGRYVISKLLGTGGMSQVYLARDKKLLDRPVVIKILRERPRESQWLIQKFQQEKEALVRVDHPGIVRILDAGEMPNGAPYIVMEYVEGVTLRSALQPNGMPLERIASIIEQLTSALEVAHQRGIIHRDLKPENIMIQSARDDSELVRIIDFGIAKVQRSLMAPTTATSITVGTVAYMSPEQLQASPVTAAADIYALGIITYEMVTGRRPFNPDSAYQLLEMQRAGTRILPRDLRPTLPEAAQDAIIKALNFNPSQRYQKARDFGEDFKKAFE